MGEASSASYSVISVCLTLLAACICVQAETQSEREAMYYKYLDFPKYVEGGKVEPHWMADGNSFWYAEGAPEEIRANPQVKEIYTLSRNANGHSHV